MSNHNSNKQLYFRYVCPTCSRKFKLETPKESFDPYPRNQNVPEEEHIRLCLKCRKDQDCWTVDLQKMFDE